MQMRVRVYCWWGLGRPLTQPPFADLGRFSPSVHVCMYANVYIENTYIYMYIYMYTHSCVCSSCFGPLEYEQVRRWVVYRSRAGRGTKPCVVAVGI